MSVTELRSGSTRPSVAVVVTSYNYERFLGTALDSVLSQDDPAEQLIVVDDGSTDGSRALLARYEGRLSVVLQENGGQGAAFNTAFALLTTDVVVFLDADDVLLPGALRRVRAEWRPGLSKLHWQMPVIDIEGRRTGAHQPLHPPPSGDLRAVLREDGPVPVAFASPPTSGNAFAVPALAPAFPIDAARWRTDADTVLLTAAPVAGPVLRLDDPLSEYRHHGDNASIQRRGRDGLVRARELTQTSAALLAQLQGLSSDTADRWLEESWAARLLLLWDMVVASVPERGDLVMWDDWWTGWSDIEGRRVVRPYDADADLVRVHVVPWWQDGGGQGREVATGPGGSVLTTA